MTGTCFASPRAARASQRGVSLVETSVAMVIMGVAATILWHTFSVSSTRESRAQASAHLARAEAAVLAFVAIHHRFPCPAPGDGGWESCEGGRATGVLPHLTLGLPEAGALRVLYTLAPAIATEERAFKVLVNDRPIQRNADPRAVPVALKTLLGDGYDGMLDVCEGLAQVSYAGGAAFSLEAVMQGPLPTVNPGPTRSRGAVQVSSYLGCGAMVSVAGRGQYNAHLAAAIMSKATQDQRIQSELAYALNHWNLAEGVWSFSNGMYGSMKNWAKLLQTSSALDANIWSNPGPFVALHAEALTDRAVELAGLAARLSGMMRYVDNLQTARKNRSANNELVRRTLEIHGDATRHAFMGSSSAYFLREQWRAPALPATAGPASDYGLNAEALRLTESGTVWADILDQGDLLSPHTLSHLPAPAVE